ncbi:tetratricopeptide repeat protein, partial [Micromonospora sp. STR1_7]
LSELGRLEEALPLHRRALEITGSALPAGHPDMALRLANLAQTLAALGRPEEASPLWQRALEINQAVERSRSGASGGG